MKKYLVVLLSVLAIVAFATSSFARHEVKDQFEYTPQVVKSSKAMIILDGEIRIRGEISDNNEDLRDTDDNIGSTGIGNCNSGGGSDCRDDQAFYDQRVRLGIKATVSPNTMGYVQLETGNTASADGYEWGESDGATGGIYRKSDGKRDDLYIRQAYIAHQGSGLLGIPAGFKAGHMLLALGNGLFFDHSKFGDDALIFWLAPMDGLEVSLITIKLDEGTNTYLSTDADAYVVAAEGAFGPVNFSGDVTYLVDNSFGGVTNNFGTNDGDLQLNATLWNIGLRADVDVAIVNIYGDVEFQTGTVEDFKTTAGMDDMDLSGWAVMVGANAKINDMISVGVEGAYGSGDDIDTDDEYEGFINSIGSGQHFTYLYDQHVQTSGQTAGALIAARGNANKSSQYIGNVADNTGLNNTWYLNAGADIKATPDLKISADLYYLAASQSVADNDSTANAEKTDETDIGVEIDGKITYQLDTNIVYYVEAGYLFAGDFYTNVTRTDEVDDAWSVRNGLLLSF